VNTCVHTCQKDKAAYQITLYFVRRITPFRSFLVRNLITRRRRLFVTFTDAVNLGRVGHGYAQVVGRKSNPAAPIYSLRTKKWTCNSTDLHLRYVF